MRHLVNINIIMVAGLALALSGCDDSKEKPGPTADGGGQVDDSGKTDGGGGKADAGETNPLCTAAIAAKKKMLVDNKIVTDKEIQDWSIEDWDKMKAKDPTAAGKAAKDGAGKYWEGADAIAGKYWDDLSVHPGCKPRVKYDENVDIFNSATWGGTNEATVPTGSQANSGQDTSKLLAGYTCAAKIYKPRSAGVDATLPIVLLQHGNSGSPNHFEAYGQQKLAGTTTQSGGFTYTIASSPKKMLASQLVEAGYQVIASDLRTDLVASLDGVNAKIDHTHKEYGDTAGNIDHGWGTPILQQLLKVLFKNTQKKVSIVGHSYGYSVMRDALRRIYLEYRAGTYSINPYTRLQDLVLASGTAHGVASGAANCAFYVTLRGRCNCQMGDRDSYSPTEFNKRINGPKDLFAAPCADGSYAYGKQGQCGGHVVRYTTITMKDLVGGKYQDEYVSEGASKLNLDKCVDNQLITNNGFDNSGFLLGGKLLANHLGSIRSQEGIALILKALSD